MPKKIPVRQCAACRRQTEKSLLARVVRTPQGEIIYDPKGLEKAIKSRALSRALDCPIPEEVYETLRRQLAEEERADGQ